MKRVLIFSTFLCRSEFTTYSQQSMDQLMRNIVQTSSSLQSNKWLAGAKVIYDVVQKKRSEKGLSTKPFMDWVGIQQQVERLSIGIIIIFNYLVILF